jgi:hypothetical protein
VAARRLTVENEVLREQVRALEERVASLALEAERPATRTRAPRPQ